MPRLLPGTFLLERVSGLVEEVPGVEEHEGENMEDLDIIRHEPGSSPSRGPGSGGLMSYDIQIFRDMDMRPGFKARGRAAEYN
ncbi:unnamed protein product [Boreogadus saida]